MSKYVYTVCVTPLNADYTVPTLMHTSYDSKDYINAVSTGYFPGPLVVEVWELEESERMPEWAFSNYDESFIKAWRNITLNGTRRAKNKAADVIKYAMSKLKPGQYMRLRRLTPAECYGLMGCNSEQTDKLMSTEFRDADGHKVSKKKSNAIHYGLAGNSIVVDVLREIFTNLLIKNINNEKEFICACQSGQK